MECPVPGRSDTGRRGSAAEDRNSQASLVRWELYFGLPGDQEVTRDRDTRCSGAGVTVTAADGSGNGGHGSGPSVST
ncbi:hypothetical protein ASD48_37660 [Streptomyces sp. Root1310]|nr:hypothetical protein ASD48_37660 [Streptomyces sp. Root1310]